MKEFLLRPSAALLLGVLLLCTGRGIRADADDWMPLFDGHSLNGWHTYGEPTPRPGWIVLDGAIVLDVDAATTEEAGGDLVSDLQFENFELEVEWKISDGGNSGVFFGVRELEDMHVSYLTGVEMQILDNDKHLDGQSLLTSAGACYGLYPTGKDVVRPVGEYNLARLVVNHGRVEHWLNGRMVAAYDMNSDEWALRVAKSKFADWPHFAKYRRGHISLQDHGDRVSFRNIRIREL
jgi:hypothetical protein